MEIEFENIGFIRKGKIETNNITIIFGPNNVGKTYLSYSTYAAISRYNASLKIKIKVPNSVSVDLVTQGKASYDISDVFTEDLIKSVNDEVSSSLPAFFKDLSGMFAKSKIYVIDSSIQNRVLAAEVNVSISVSENIVINIQKKRNNACIDFSVVSAKNENKGKNPIGALKEKEALNYLNLLFNHFFINEILDSSANEPFIITSERTGISLFQKEIDDNRSNLVDSYMTSRISKTVLSLDDIMRQKVATFSEPINHNVNIIRDFTNIRKFKQLTDFNKMKRSNRKDRVRNDIISTLESLTGGQYEPRNNEAIFTVNCKNGESVSMPLSLSSASNKALFLLDIYVRHYMSSNSYLIIDEPELNLHPQNQIKMAELLVRMSNYGVKIIITTHSDYIVKEINNRIMASQVKNKDLLASFNYTAVDLVGKSDVNAFTIGEDGIIHNAGGNKFGVNAFIFDNVITDIDEKQGVLFSYLEDEA
ncbi:AAA family ATPase [Pectobacterium versatile]|uniref:AAA family ATPase n=1 Tax=Pectobacterium versatile TaxID=2488639 RepID=UPI003018B7C3